MVVSAHANEPRLEISSDRINPGGVIELRGVDFEFEKEVDLALVGPDIEVQLGEITADTEGIFLRIVIIPVNLREGVYHFVALTDDHETLSPALTVQGPPILNEIETGQGLRNEEDGLLAPMPTSAQDVMAEDASRTETNAESQNVAASNRNTTLFVVFTLVIVRILAVAGFNLARKR